MSQYQRNFLSDFANVNPTVRPIDTYYQPTQRGVAGPPIGENPVSQIAKALGRFDQGLHQYYFQPQHEKMKRQAEVDAQIYKDQYENMQAFSEAVKNGEIEHGDNPWLQVYTKELFAKENANEMSIRIAELSDRQDILGADDPIAAFDAAVQEIQNDILGDTSDLYFRQAFGRHAAPMIARGANQFAQGLRRYRVDDAAAAFRNNLSTELEMIYDKLASGEKLTAEDMAAQITEALRTMKKSNLLPDHVMNQMVIDELMGKARAFGDTNSFASDAILDTLELIETVEGAKLIGSGTEASKVQILRDQLSDRRYTLDRRLEHAEKEEKIQQTEDAFQFIMDSSRAMSREEIKDEAKKQFPLASAMDIDSFTQLHISRSKDTERELVVESREEVDREIAILTSSYRDAKTPEERAQVLAAMAQFRSSRAELKGEEGGLSVQQIQRVDSFIDFHMNKTNAEKSAELNRLVSVLGVNLLAPFKERDFSTGRMILSQSGVQVNAMWEQYASELLIQRMEDEDAGPVTSEELRGIAESSFEKAKEFVNTLSPQELTRPPQVDAEGNPVLSLQEATVEEFSSNPVAKAIGSMLKAHQIQQLKASDTVLDSETVDALHQDWLDEIEKADRYLQPILDVQLTTNNPAFDAVIKTPTVGPEVPFGGYINSGAGIRDVNSAKRKKRGLKELQETLVVLGSSRDYDIHVLPALKRFLESDVSRDDLRSAINVDRLVLFEGKEHLDQYMEGYLSGAGPEYEFINKYLQLNGIDHKANIWWAKQMQLIGQKTGEVWGQAPSE